MGALLNGPADSSRREILELSKLALMQGLGAAAGHRIASRRGPRLEMERRGLGGADRWTTVCI